MWELGSFDTSVNIYTRRLESSEILFFVLSIFLKTHLKKIKRIAFGIKQTVLTRDQSRAFSTSGCHEINTNEHLNICQATGLVLASYQDTLFSIEVIFPIISIPVFLPSVFLS
jgi:hypothetical protein